jgi:hypothetical protein
VTTPTISEIDGLPALVVLEGGWRDKYANVIEAHELVVLSITVRGDGVSFLERLPGLRGLVVLNAGSIGDLSPVASLTQLETLASSRSDCGSTSSSNAAIESCRKLATLDAVAGRPLTRLKVANCGDIASLAPLRGMDELEEFFAWESTRSVDGDLSVLAALPRPRAIGMHDRSSDRPRVHEIEATL